jgi:lipopolysaccharide/colanic/teichoic acid biosynthesis glycosyltransferase
MKKNFLIYQNIKMILDFIFACCCLFIFSPILLAIAVTIYFEDRKSPIFTQRRAGKKHRAFTIYKFRSMKINTPNLSTADLQRSGINPNTRIGYFLRKSSLDELPQLLNIIKGEMSFIGPRPALLTQINVLNDRESTGVQYLFPGITGLAQVRGRDNLSDKEKVELDTLYFENFGVLQDVRILLETGKAVLSSNGNK